MTLRSIAIASFATLSTAFTAALYFNRLSDFALEFESGDLSQQLLERNDD